MPSQSRARRSSPLVHFPPLLVLLVVLRLSLSPSALFSLKTLFLLSSLLTSAFLSSLLPHPGRRMDVCTFLLHARVIAPLYSDEGMCLHWSGSLLFPEETDRCPPAYAEREREREIEWPPKNRKPGGWDAVESPRLHVHVEEFVDSPRVSMYIRLSPRRASRFTMRERDRLSWFSKSKEILGCFCYVIVWSSVLSYLPPLLLFTPSAPRFFALVSTVSRETLWEAVRSPQARPGEDEGCRIPRVPCCF